MYEEMKTEPGRVIFPNEIVMDLKLKGIPQGKTLKKGAIVAIDGEGLVGYQKESESQTYVIVAEETKKSTNIGERINVRCIVSGCVDVKFPFYLTENFDRDDSYSVSIEEDGVFLLFSGLFLVETI